MYILVPGWLGITLSCLAFSSLLSVDTSLIFLLFSKTF